MSAYNYSSMARLKDEMFVLLTQAGPSGHALAMQILGNRDDAADVVQDAALAALDAGRFDPERGKFRPWFLTIVRNRCVDVLRQRARKPESTLVGIEPLSEERDPSVAVEVDETVGFLKTELARMSSEQREILVLRDYLGMSYEDISNVLSIPNGTVMSRLHRARLALAARMKRQR